jgi:GTP-binding protein HflX
MKMYENNRPTVRDLCAVDLGEYDVEVSLDELEELAKTAGARVLGKVSQKRSEFDSATCMGAGKLEEIAEFCAATQADLLIFDHELTASQIRNIEKITDVQVIDRTMLILDIFAQRANTAEGRLQVEAAQLRYRQPLLADGRKPFTSGRRSRHEGRRNQAG